jgi:hypothetical protein
MATPARARVFDRVDNLLGAGPQMPPLVPFENSEAFRKRLMDIESAFTLAMTGWRDKLAELRRNFKDNFEEEVHTSDDESVSLRDLHQLITKLRSDNSARKVLHYVMSLSFEKLEQDTTSRSEGDARFVRDIATRILKETALEYAARNDFLEFLEKFYYNRSHLKIVPTAAALMTAIENCEKDLETDGAVRDSSQLNVLIDQIKRFGLPADFVRDGEAELARRKTEIEQFNNTQWQKFNVMKSSVLGTPTPEIVEMVHGVQKALTKQEQSLRHDCEVTDQMIEAIATNAASEQFPKDLLRRALGYRLEPKVMHLQVILAQSDAVLELLAKIDPNWRHQPAQREDQALSAAAHSNTRQSTSKAADAAPMFVYSKAVRARFWTFLAMSVVGVTATACALVWGNLAIGIASGVTITVSGFVALSWLELANSERTIIR